MIIRTLLVLLFGATLAQAQQAVPAPGAAPVNRLPVKTSEAWAGAVSARLQQRANLVVSAARERGVVGDYSVKIGFTIAPDGSVSNARLVQASGNAVVDEAALLIPAYASPFPAFPNVMSRHPRPIVAPLVFKLTPPPPAAPAGSPG